MPALEIQGVSKSFRMGKATVPVLKGVTYRFEPRTVTTIQGASGSGKSTLLHVLAGLDRPDAGVVLLDGQHVYELGSNRLADLRNNRIGFVFQAYHLLPEFTALENVALPSLIRRSPDLARAADLLAQVGLADRADHRPMEMSGGEQQRVCIARALANAPDLLFADEPTGNLDSASGRAVLDLLLDLQGHHGLTVIMVTHDAGIAAAGRCRLRLSDGALGPA